MNNCNFSVHNDNGNAVKQLDVEKLEVKLESLIIEVSTLKEMVIIFNRHFLNLLA
jgi:hypothetical protein